MNFKTVLLTPEQVLKSWHLIEPDIEKALAHGIDEMSTFDLFKQALNSKVFVWATLDENNKIVGTSTSRFINYDSTKTCQLITHTTNGVSHQTIEQEHRVLEDFAKLNGCSHIQVWGRKGWERRLQNLTSRQGNKYKTQYYVYDMEI